MGEEVKRRYDGSRRRSSAEHTRRRIIDQAARLFLQRGYARTSIEAIAEAAAVSPATVYKVFGNKVAIVKAVGDVAVVGDHEPIPLAERDWVRAAQVETDAERAIALVVSNVVALLARLSPIIEMVGAAAAVEPELAALADAGDRGRYQGVLAFVASLHAHGQLRPGLSVENGADMLYALQSPHTFITLVHRRGWSVDHFRDWLLDQVPYALLGPTRPTTFGAVSPD
jgi:AcrR family transcriptional regulator